MESLEFSAMCGYHQALSDNQWLLRNAKLERMISRDDVTRFRQLMLLYLITQVEIFLIKKPYTFFHFTRSLTILSLPFYLPQNPIVAVPDNVENAFPWKLEYDFYFTFCQKIVTACYNSYVTFILIFFYSFMNVCDLSFLIWCYMWMS